MEESVRIRPHEEKQRLPRCLDNLEISCESCKVTIFDSEDGDLYIQTLQQPLVVEFYEDWMEVLESDLDEEGEKAVFYSFEISSVIIWLPKDVEISLFTLRKGKVNDKRNVDNKL